MSNGCPMRSCVLRASYGLSLSLFLLRRMSAMVGAGYLRRIREKRSLSVGFREAKGAKVGRRS